MSQNHHSPSSACAAFAPLLPLAGRQMLEEADASRLRAHLTTCAACRAQLAIYDQVEAALRRSFAPRQDASPPFTREEIMQTFDPRVDHPIDHPLDLPAPSAPLPAPALPRPRSRRLLAEVPALAATLLIALAAVILFSVYQLSWSPDMAGVYLRGASIDEISCNALEQTAVHYHAHLSIFINGQQIHIPNDVGRQPASGCYYWLHTHADAGDAGVIHVESPDNRVYKLYQFFDIWGQTFTATNLLGHQVDAAHPLTVYAYDPTAQPTDSTQPFTVTPPGDLQPYTGDPRQIVIKPHELITLEYGAPIVPPPAFTFLAGE